MDIKAADIRSKIDFINEHALKDTDYKIRTSKNVVYLNNKITGGQTEVILHSKTEVYKFLFRFDNFLMLITDKALIHTIFKNCD